MTRFVTCLNNPAKIYNMSVFGLVCGAAGFVFGLCAGNILVGFGGALLACTGGTWLHYRWHAGQLPRLLYKYFPLTHHLGGKNLPPYNIRKLR